MAGNPISATVLRPDWTAGIFTEVTNLERAEGSKLHHA